MNDEDLLAEVLSGNPDWDGIYRAYSADVYSAAQQVLRRHLRSVDSKDVEDVIQQTFEEAMKGGVLTPDTRSIPAKLRTVATRRALDAVRRARHIADADPADLPIETDPIEELVEREFLEDFGQAIWRNQRLLTERERVIFRAHHYDGESFADIGRRTNLTGQRVGQIFGKAARKLVAGLDLGRDDVDGA